MFCCAVLCCVKNRVHWHVNLIHMHTRWNYTHSLTWCTCIFHFPIKLNVSSRNTFPYQRPYSFTHTIEFWSQGNNQLTISNFARTYYSAKSSLLSHIQYSPMIFFVRLYDKTAANSLNSLHTLYIVRFHIKILPRKKK